MRDTIAAGQLRAFIERIERLEEEKKTIQDDIKDVYAEAKGTGFDTKAIRTIVRLRKKDQAEREEEESILDLYMSALGMLPLFERADEEAASNYAKAKSGGAQKQEITVKNHARQGVEGGAQITPPHDPITGEILSETDTGGAAPEVSDPHTIQENSNTSPAESEVNEISATNSPEEAATFTRQTPPETGSDGYASQTSGQSDLPEAWTGQNSAVLPQEPCKATNHEMPAAPTSQRQAAPEDSAPQASGAPNRAALSKVDQIRLLRPNCRHPGSDLRGGAGRTHCRACENAAQDQERSHVGRSIAVPSGVHRKPSCRSNYRTHVGFDIARRMIDKQLSKVNGSLSDRARRMELEESQ